MATMLHRLIQNDCLLLRVNCILALVQQVILNKFGIVLKLVVSYTDVAFEWRIFINHSLFVCIMSLAR